MPYTPTNWVSGTTPLDQPELSNLETQYTEATNSFEQELFQAFVFSGFACTKDGVNALQLDVTAGIAFLKQADGTLRRRSVSSATFLTSGMLVTWWLFLKNDGTWQWSTSNTGPANSIMIATVNTNIGGTSINTITDNRPTTITLFSGCLGGVSIPNGTSIGGTLGVTGAVTLSSTLGVTGLLTATGGLATNSIASISGNVIFSNGITMPASTNINTDALHTVSSTGGMTITVGSSGFLGIKNSSGTKLAEAKANGNFTISGAYQTTGATSTIATGQTFDAFDFAECYVCDKDYENGTVVCLDEYGKMTRCTHDNCPAALIVSKVPAYMAGDTDEADPDDHVTPLALVGRVRALTGAEGVARGRHVVSDGQGGVRALARNRWGYALGVAITDTDESGRVGILLRPMYCKGA